MWPKPLLFYSMENCFPALRYQTLNLLPDKSFLPWWICFWHLPTGQCAGLDYEVIHRQLDLLLLQNFIQLHSHSESRGARDACLEHTARDVWVDHTDHDNACLKHKDHDMNALSTWITRCLPWTHRSWDVCLEHTRLAADLVLQTGNSAARTQQFCSSTHLSMLSTSTAMER